MLAAYWHKNGLEIYRLSKGSIEKAASDRAENLSPIKSLDKKVLIIGNDLLFHMRKKYPAASDKDIKEAVQTEAPDISPVKNPDCFSRIFEKSDAYSLVDIWLWDCSEYESLKSAFRFTHAVPEDLLYLSEEPEISLMSGKVGLHAVAHSSDGFIGTSTFKGDAATGRRLALFIKSLGRYSCDIKALNLYGGIKAAQDLKELHIRIQEREMKPYPSCLDNLPRLDLKEFRVKPDYGYIMPYGGIAARAAIYLIVAYSLSLFITLNNFESAINKTDSLIRSLSKEVESIAQARQEGASSEIISRDFKEKMKDAIPVLSIMDKLAERLPEKTSISRISFSGRTAVLLLSSKEPLNVIRALGGSGGFRTVKLRGAPTKTSTGIYNFELSIE